MKKGEKPYGGQLKALDTLFGEAPAAAGEMIPLSQIRTNPDQPRSYFGETELQSLAASIRERGVLQPLLVRPLPGGTFELVAGERRYRAATLAGLEEVPAVVRELTGEEALELALLENLQREDLNPVEETDAVLRLLGARLGKPTEDVITVIRQLYDEGRGRSGTLDDAGNSAVSREERKEVEVIFALLGRLTPGSFYTHRLPLLKLPGDVLEAVRSGRLHHTKARELAKVRDDEARNALLARALFENLSLAELKQEVKVHGAVTADPMTERLARLRRSLTPRKLERLEGKSKKRAEKLLSELEVLFSEEPV